MTYNGWTNYETWAVGMYLDGNYTGEGTYREVLDIVREVRDESGGSDAAVYALEDRLKDYVVEREMGEIAGIVSDLANAALDEVNWRELAKSQLDEVD